MQSYVIIPGEIIHNIYSPVNNPDRIKQKKI